MRHQETWRRGLPYFALTSVNIFKFLCVISQPFSKETEGQRIHVLGISPTIGHRLFQGPARFLKPGPTLFLTSYGE